MRESDSAAFASPEGWTRGDFGNVEAAQLRGRYTTPGFLIDASRLY
jgi:hypothetical protein